MKLARVNLYLESGNHLFVTKYSLRWCDSFIIQLSQYMY